MKKILFRFLLPLAALWAGAVGALHLGQIRHNRVPFDLEAAFPAGQQFPQGAAFATTLAEIVRHELDDGFGWRPNDLPIWGMTIGCDNNANRQLGILQAVRETTRVFKDHLTKVSSDRYDSNLVEADTMFRNDPHKLWLPGAEGRYRRGVQALLAYARGLSPALQTSSPLKLRHVELIRLLQAWTDLLGDAHANLFSQSPEGKPISAFKTDDYFYRAQGYAHVIYQMTRAVEKEYAQTLETQPILASLFRGVEEALGEAAALKPIVVLDGPPAGIFANHRRNLDGYITEARQKLYSIREELEK